MIIHGLVREELCCVSFVVIHLETGLNEASDIKTRAHVNNETILFHFTHLKLIANFSACYLIVTTLVYN